jgi:hypothetical protein
MSKKKNTLQDLNDFLKQQAATLVSPPRLSDKTESQLEELQESPVMREFEPELSAETILDDIKQLSRKEAANFRRKFYDMIIKSMEAQTKSLPEDKMLINTALYLKDPERWKENIREYWRHKAD